MEFNAIDTLWVLVAAALVMLMQAGFAMVETGMARKKNTVNILMKNLVDFSVGSLFFWIIGYGLMFGADTAGLFGKVSFFNQGDFSHLGLTIPAPSMIIFQTVFAATAATIVSGAIAERTKFEAYIIVSILITALVYPISGHWIWGGGWLSQLETPFHDFAGSTVVHSVGAWIGLAGAIVVGPRIGKYVKGKTRAIPGSNMSAAALGVFVLWFGWFGFNGGSQLAASTNEDAIAISNILINTNLAAAAGALMAVIFSWIKYGKPSLGMSLNGSLAGLVAVTAGCDIVAPGGAAIMGALGGLVVILAVEFIDKKLKIDDPVGAVSVHGVNGALGTLYVGLFATEGGLFYGDGAALLGSQAIGVAAVAAWALGAGFLMFWAIKKIIGVRVSKEVEMNGLDVSEHGESAYHV